MNTIDICRNIEMTTSNTMKCHQLNVSFSTYFENHSHCEYKLSFEMQTIN